MKGVLAVAPANVRCAIYTRRSVESGFVTEFGSIENQRDMCSAYIRSQRHRRWVELPGRYDDSGISGGTLARPGLERLLADIEQGLVDMVVIYKIDRLTRSLSNFMRLVEQFENYGVAFVCVTQTFDTRDTVGRLILNILLTFAQFEREMTSDRIRDRYKTLARNGRWIGGRLPLGYDLVDRRLVINPREAAVVREIFERFVALGSYKELTAELARNGHRTKGWTNARGERVGGNRIQPITVRKMLCNHTYVGEIAYKGAVYPAVHEPIISRELWDAVQVRAAGLRTRTARKTAPHLLTGLLYDGLGRSMSGDSARREETEYRYYRSTARRGRHRGQRQTVRVDAPLLEEMTRSAICAFFRDRFALGGAALKCGRLDAEIEGLLGRGPATARLLETLDGERLRATYAVLLRRIDITRDQVRIAMICDAIVAALGWDGFGQLRAPVRPARSGDQIHVIEFSAEHVRVGRAFTMPVRAREPDGIYAPDRKLVALVAEARAIQEAIHAERYRSLGEIARNFGRRAAYAARLIRLNYLAPDILTAIMDGRQPPDLTPRRLLFGEFAMDWTKQRSLFGFPAQDELMHGSANYARRMTARLMDSAETYDGNSDSDETLPRGRDGEAS